MTHKQLLIVPAVLLAALLTACSTKSGQSSPSHGDEVTIQSGTYVRPSDVSAPTKGHAYLALKLKVKNNGKAQTLMGDEDFALRDSKKNKVKPTMVTSSGDGDSFETISTEKLHHGATTTGYIVFNVDKSKKYTLELTPTTDSGKEESTTKLAMSPKKYKDKTAEPKKALQAYISEVFLNKKNLDYDKLVANNAKTDKQQYQSATRKYLEDAFDAQITDDASNKMISDIQDVNGKKARAVYAIKSVTPNSAEITVTPIVLKLTSLSEVIDNVQSSAQDAVDQSNEDDDEADDSESLSPDDVEAGAKNAVYEKFPELLTKLPIRQADDSDIKMTKVNHKWKFDTSDDEFKSLMQDYTGESY
ncbi:DUF5105 domain-containing protein [Furfurilactobacillus cerevisiae]|uniref:DUF5105 domain-containing protein n=1 Tax=Furfurilactobacillus rossiae TaxID=231049 RepID=UPI003B98068B